MLKRKLRTLQIVTGSFDEALVTIDYYLLGFLLFSRKNILVTKDSKRDWYEAGQLMQSNEQVRLNRAVSLKRKRLHEQFKSTKRRRNNRNTNGSTL